MINDKNIRAINKHMKHMKSMNNARKFKNLAIERRDDNM